MTIATPADAPALPNDHFVSRGYQQNFADEDKRVAIIDARSGALVDPRRPIKSNFCERGFTTYIEAGVPNDLLERAFASVERSVLNQIREVDLDRCGPTHKAAVANLFAVHLVRSPSFKAFRNAIGEQFRITDVPEFATSAELRARFEASEGRPPRGGELLDLLEAVYADFDSDPLTLVESMLRNHDKVAEMLNRFAMQVVRIDVRLPGLVVGDTPVVHANEGSGKYGFRDRLALGDANLIIGPLTRRTLALFTARPVPNTTVTTRRTLDAINAIFMRAASDEVACHPDDIVKVRQIHYRLDRLPPSLLKRGRAPR